MDWSTIALVASGAFFWLAIGGVLVIGQAPNDSRPVRIAILCFWPLIAVVAVPLTLAYLVKTLATAVFAKDPTEWSAR